MTDRSISTPARARRPFGARQIFAGAFFCIWSGGVLTVLGALSRPECAPPVPAWETSAENRAAVAGWSVRHWLPAGHALTTAIVEQLSRRGPLAGLSEELHVVDPGGELATRLRRAGWTVVGADRCTEPRVEIFSPDRALRWSGTFRANDFDTPGALMLDDVVLLRLVRGDAVGPHVPVGCATTLGPESTGGSF